YYRPPSAGGSMRLIGLGVLALAMPALAGREAPANRSADDAVTLRAARLLDGSGGALLQAQVVVRDGRVLSVGPAAGPVTGRLIDLGALTLLPGLIDAHSHV